LTAQERANAPGPNAYEIFGDKAPWESGPMVAANASKEGALPALANALDMSPEARLARAKEMGFDTSRTLYHGTKSEFDEFNTTRGDYGDGVYLTPNQYIANQYAGWTDGANVRPVYVRGDVLEANGGNTVLVSDPRNIRSVNAAFDPAKSDSADLLAANASKGAGAASVASQPNNQTDILGLLSSLFARGRK